MTKFLITGARAPVALELARNLNKHGHYVVMADSLRFPISRNTNAIKQFYHIVKPRHNIKLFKNSLLEIIQKENIDFLIPTCEEVFYIAHIKPLLEKSCQVICPSFELISQFHSKSKILDLCSELDINIPKTSKFSLKELSKISDFTEKVVKREFCRFGTDVIINPTPKLIQKIKPHSAHHEFLLQEKIHGVELCAYAIAYGGEINAESIYQPIHKLKQAAGIYFDPVENISISNFIQKFCQKYQITGQISFDFIVNKQGTYLIECNPRATSGLHLLNNKNLSLCFIGKNQFQNDTKISEAKMVRLAMLLLALPKALISLQFKSWWADFNFAKDVISSNKDKRFLLYPFLSLAELVFIAIKEKVSLRAASTMDIEWDGEDIL